MNEAMNKAMNEAFERMITCFKMLPHFPMEPDVHRAIVREVFEFAETPAQIKWLTDTIVRSCPRWPGITTLRGLFCTQYKPKDGGFEPPCTIPGYKPYDREAKAILEYQSPRLTGEQMPEAELADFHREIINPLIEHNMLPDKKTKEEIRQGREKIRAVEAEIAAAAKVHRTPEEHQRQVMELEITLGLRKKEIGVAGVSRPASESKNRGGL